MAEEKMSKRMLGLTDDDGGKKSAADKKSGSVLSNKQWVVLGVLMGGAGVALGGIMSYFNRGHM